MTVNGICCGFFAEVRNINVHNGGVINDIFASRVGAVEGFAYVKGKTFHVDMDALVTLSENAMRVAMHIDATVSAKFGLLRKAHRSWKRSRKVATKVETEILNDGTAQ